jgi:hypothetical protein
MTIKKTGEKGLKTEELLRSYFLRAGFFVLRGVRLQISGEDLTDIDLWIYERSATLARRRTIIDIKDKKTPQAAERLFFVKGLAQAIKVDAAGVATTDNRPALREFARRQGLIWIDGIDLGRLKLSPELTASDRISEETLLALINDVDTSRRSRIYRDNFELLKAAIVDRFGAASGNAALEVFGTFARESVAAHPNSPAAQLAGRITYLAGAIAAASFDFASAESALRPSAERQKHLTEMIRYGDDAEGTRRRLNWAETAIREYAPNGAGVAMMVREKFTAQLRSVPAEALAEIIARFSKNEALFSIAKGLERAAYASAVPTFDALPLAEKSFLAAALDFVQVERTRFSAAWSYAAVATSNEKPAASETAPQAEPPPDRLI